MMRPRPAQRWGPPRRNHSFCTFITRGLTTHVVSHRDAESGAHLGNDDFVTDWYERHSEAERTDEEGGNLYEETLRNLRELGYMD
jgi:hypothetical protein